MIPIIPNLVLGPYNHTSTQTDLYMNLTRNFNDVTEYCPFVDAVLGDFNNLYVQDGIMIQKNLTTIGLYDLNATNMTFDAQYIFNVTVKNDAGWINWFEVNMTICSSE